MDSGEGEARSYLLMPRAPHVRSNVPSVTLDQDQQRLIELPADRSALVLGVPGSGKTTVSLHRLRSLRGRKGVGGRAFQAVMLVPTPGLRELARAGLKRLRLSPVEVFTVDEWLSSQGRRVFRDTPRSESRDATSAIIGFKRHPAVRLALAELAKELGYGRRAKHFDLFHLWGDRALLDFIVKASAGDLHENAAREVLEHVCVQFRDIDEDGEIDSDALPTTDSLPIDEGTPEQDVGSIDVEDFPVLFRLDRQLRGLRNLGKEGLSVYDHIVLDEAQEIAPMELNAIAMALSPRGSMTIVGDECQQTDQTAYFRGWPALLTELSQEEAETITLRAEYRCPPTVAALGRCLMQSGPKVEPTTDLVLSVVPTQQELVSLIGQELAQLATTDPRATIAVICATQREAIRMARLLRSAASLRVRAPDDDRARPGVTVAVVDDIRGLEFDFVVLPDVTEANYPYGDQARRALYVAVTRTRFQLWILVHGRTARILQNAVRVADDIGAHASS